MGSGYSLVAVSQWYIQGSKHYGRQGFAEASARWKPDDLNVDLSGQVHVVTGANAGLGLATATALAKRKAEVHMLCRNMAKGRAARDVITQATGNDAVHVHEVDISDVTSVKSFASSWASTGKPVHVLVNNAGVLPAACETTKDGLELAMATALGGTYLLTGLLLPALAKAGSSSPVPSRIINVSSGGGLTVKLAVEDLHATARGKDKYDGTLQYAHAKRAQMMLTEMWADKLKSAGAPVVCHSMHPGWAETPGVKTSLADFAKNNEGKLRTEEQGGDTIVWLAAAKDPRIASSSGTFWFDREPAVMHFPLASTKSTSAEYHALWQHCERDFKWTLEPEKLLRT